MVEMSGQEIYDNFHNGVGPEGLATGAAAVKEVAARYRERAQEIHRLTIEMESAWQGDAAGDARRGAGPLLTEHEVASHHLSVSEDLTDRQSGSFFRARNSVVPVPPAPSDVPPWGPLSPGWMPHKQRVQEHNDAARHNVDVMNVYSGASIYNTDHLPTSYGSLAGDESGAVVDDADTINSEAFRHQADSGPDNSGPPSGPGPGRGQVDGIHVVSQPGQPAPGSHSTMPDKYSPTPDQPPKTPLPVTDLGQTRPQSAGGPVTGVGVGFFGPVSGYSPSESGHVRPGDPRRAGMPMPRGDIPGVEPTASNPTRPAPITGRGTGTSVHGVPLGAGRGRADDKERTAPTYLEGGNPEDLFGTEVLTAPPVIGDEDDD